MIVRIEWVGPRKAYLLRGAIQRNCTSKQSAHPDGSVTWNECFDHHCKLKPRDSKGFRRWMINLQILEFGSASNRPASIIESKSKVDIAAFACPTANSEQIVKFPVKYCINGSTSTHVATLTMKLSFFEIQSEHTNSTVHPISPKLLLPSLSSCIRFQNQTDDKGFINIEEQAGIEFSRDWNCSPVKSNGSSNSESDEESELTYRNLAMTNLLSSDTLCENFNNKKDENWDAGDPPNYQVKQKPSLIRLLSWNKCNHSFRVPNFPRGTPLLNKANGEDGGDDIDNDRRCQLASSQPRCSQGESDSGSCAFTGSDRFEIGTWEKRKLVSRDGKLELETEIFLASIDQRSERASGEGACTVLAVTIADWLHQNPEILPLRCQLDKLVREGSSEWRNLCESVVHMKEFLDQHFDLDTVLQEQVRPLTVIPEKSYVGFFELENMPNRLEFLKGAMSFDSIWEELGRSERTIEKEIYIVSWNDHFFVLKVEVNVIYIIDTLGERLFEGCNKAFILKFNIESKVFKAPRERRKREVDSEAITENHSTNAGEEDETSHRELVCQGKSTCKEFIKGFLAALPLRELQADIEKKIIGEAPLHHRLQIEFHYTAPCNRNSHIKRWS